MASKTQASIEFAEEARIRPPEKMREMIQVGKIELDEFFFHEDGSMRESRVVTREQCPVCHGKQLSSSASDGPWPLAVCDCCGARFAHAVGRPDAWSEFYGQSKASEMFQRDILEVTSKQRAATIQEPLAKWVNETLPEGGALLEVGCAVGAFLEVLAATERWDVHGLDPAPEAVRLAQSKGLKNVVCGRLEAYETDTQFDALCFFGVLLHLDDPLESLHMLSSCIQPGGRIFITEINYAGFDAQIMSEDDPNFTPPRAANFFTPSSIETLLVKAGFCDIELTTPGRLDIARIYQYWQNGGTNNRHDSLKRMVDHEIETGSSRLQSLVQDSRVSGHMWATARFKS